MLGPWKYTKIPDSQTLKTFIQTNLPIFILNSDDTSANLKSKFYPNFGLGPAKTAYSGKNFAVCGSREDFIHVLNINRLRKWLLKASFKQFVKYCGIPCFDPFLNEHGFSSELSLNLCLQTQLFPNVSSLRNFAILAYFQGSYHCSGVWQKL